MAGQIAELARRTLPGDFRQIDPRTARVLLVDGADQVLGSFGGRLSEKAAAHLEDIGVEVQLGRIVVDVDATAWSSRTGTARAAASSRAARSGPPASPRPRSARQLAEQSGAELDRAGRVAVQPDLTLPGHPEVFVVGDMATHDLPGRRAGRDPGRPHAADTITRAGRGRPPAPFRYHDKGNMATISRFQAVASIGERLRLVGFVAWLMWLAVHLFYLIGFKNRLSTLIHWLVSFLGRGRAERTATSQQVAARTALVRLGLPGPTGPDLVLRGPAPTEQAAEAATVTAHGA